LQSIPFRIVQHPTQEIDKEFAIIFQREEITLFCALLTITCGKSPVVSRRAFFRITIPSEDIVRGESYNFMNVIYCFRERVKF